LNVFEVSNVRGLPELPHTCYSVEPGNDYRECKWEDSSGLSHTLRFSSLSCTVPVENPSLDFVPTDCNVYMWCVSDDPVDYSVLI